MTNDRGGIRLVLKVDGPHVVAVLDMDGVVKFEVLRARHSCMNVVGPDYDDFVSLAVRLVARFFNKDLSDFDVVVVNEVREKDGGAT